MFVFVCVGGWTLSKAAGRPERRSPMPSVHVCVSKCVCVCMCACLCVVQWLMSFVRHDACV